jgi:hypothetical protein
VHGNEAKKYSVPPSHACHLLRDHHLYPMRFRTLAMSKPTGAGTGFRRVRARVWPLAPGVYPCGSLGLGTRMSPSYPNVTRTLVCWYGFKGVRVRL